ncbi:MAG TPA: alpha-glucuronidase family glycosyl hydrolase [Steroidobacteraceae bacterium]|nr:alpha-glucuronidase family glycosyl hydrolase [Steroidobacteraceae bacterium]
MISRILISCLLIAAFSTPSFAEDGYDLWLRYRPDAAATTTVSTLVAGTASPTLDAAVAELRRGLGGLAGHEPALATSVSGPGSLVVGTPRSLPLLASLPLGLERAGAEGYVIRRLSVQGQPTLVIAANSDLGALYGAFHFLRLVRTHQPLDALDVVSAPRTKIRVLDHWDNLDRHVERGYAGESLWDWHKLPGWLDPRYTDYARACASIGINGAVLTNVNANATSLTPAYLDKAAALAGVFRPYGVRVYLTARFSAPIELGGLKTADPLDPAVRAWWRAKIDEIYRHIPDFGGFLVKANSEGQPGPQDYKRTHADGANMLAEALAPHDGIVMWRAFVYSNETPTDRAKQAYDEFKPLDGKFADNVLVQVKNGAIDFQPREPFHPLFGAMPKTPLMMEFQITKEYLGFATHLVYLGTLFEEALEADTGVKPPKKGLRATVANVLDGDLHGYRITGMAGVANIGTDRNWSGSQFDQANWYAFGRFAWNPEISARDVAEEWTRLTFGNEPKVVVPVVDMMMGSREAAVDYMTPLGLAHLMGTGHHYGPAPWVDNLGRADWNPIYYHRADANGIGFDRGAKGSNAIAQYQPGVAAMFADPKKTPEQFLLWFHHVPWDYKTRSGRILWDELVVRWTRGVEVVSQMRATWDSLRPYVDAERHAQVAAFLAIQQQEAQWWRDANIAYFQTFSKRPLPAGYAPPAHPLEYYESLKFPYAPGRS